MHAPSPEISRSPTAAAAPKSRHLAIVAIEDYYQVGAFNGLIQRGRWYRFETRVENGTRRALDLLDEFGVRATFFTLGWVAEKLPELIREVAERGHEIASKGYYHRSIRQLAPTEFREDLSRAREVLESASGRRVLGYRVADGWFEPCDLWAMDVLAEEGYAYDSSIGPMFRAYAREPWRRFAHQHRHEGRTLSEFPISTASVFGWLIPIAGGNYFRQFPHWMMRQAVRYWDRTYQAPFVMYFHTWEMDPEQPRISAASLASRVRHYRNLQRVPDILRDYLGEYRFTGIADHLGLSTALPTPQERARRRETVAPGLRAVRRETLEEAPPPVEPRSSRVPVTVVVPCYNEEGTLPYLANTLRSVEASCGSRYDLRFLFVDDCSRDGTWQTLQRVFGKRGNCSFVRHERNQGVAAAISTGIQVATTEVVCSMDCDCTYDPHELETMIPLLADDVDLVVASPYHPAGGVRNVPGWRLFLSRSASFLYRRILRQKLHTYTSCFRVYRRSTVAAIRLRHPGFLGVAEIVGKLDLTGGRIIEHPTTLEVRVLGRSKMKVARTILGHMRLLSELLRLRLMGGGGVRARAAAVAHRVPAILGLLPPHLGELSGLL